MASAHAAMIRQDLASARWADTLDMLEEAVKQLEDILNS